VKRSATVMFANGSIVHFNQTKNESASEFDDRLLCAVEDLLVGGPKNLPVPAGTRWVQWDHAYPHRLTQAHTEGTGRLLEHTGRLYTDRTRTVNRLWRREEAEALLGLGPRPDVPPYPNPRRRR